MYLNTYLTFNGDCRAAFEFYQRCLGGEIVAMLPYSEAPDGEEIPSESRDLIMHARLVVAGQVLMGSDTSPQCPLAYEGIKGTQIAVNVETAEEAEKTFHALADNGTVQMPLEETFWAVRFGMLIDKFGVPWLVNCERQEM